MNTVIWGLWVMCYQWTSKGIGAWSRPHGCSTKFTSSSPWPRLWWTSWLDYPVHLVTHHSWEGNTIYIYIRRGQNTGSWKPRCLKLAWGLSRVPLPCVDFNPYTLTVIYHNHEFSVRFETPSGKVSNQRVILETPAFVTVVGSDSVLVAWSLQLGRDPAPIFCSIQTQGFYLLGYFRAQDVCWYPRNYIIIEDWKDHKGIIVSSCPSKLK